MNLMHIGEIREIEMRLSVLVVDFHPETEAEWDALEKLVQAHHILRKIGTAALSQLPLIEE